MARDTLGMGHDYVDPPWMVPIRAAADAAHLAAATRQTLTLGTLIDQLRQAPADAPIEFAGCGLDGWVPIQFSSWRGVYADLAIEPGHPDTYRSITCGELLRLAEDADGCVFEGYKGGDFTMDRSTPVWVDEYGSSTSDRGIHSIRPLMRGGQVALVRIRLHSWADE